MQVLRTARVKELTSWNHGTLDLLFTRPTHLRYLSLKRGIKKDMADKAVPAAVPHPPLHTSSG
jgi:hypothetical protein